MRTIKKYAMSLEGKFEVNHPPGGVVAADGMWLWMLVGNDQAPTEVTKFQVFRVGDDIPNEQPMPAGHTLSFQYGGFMWHLFQLFEVSE